MTLNRDIDKHLQVAQKQLSAGEQILIAGEEVDSTSNFSKALVPIFAVSIGYLFIHSVVIASVLLVFFVFGLILKALNASSGHFIIVTNFRVLALDPTTDQFHEIAKKTNLEKIQSEKKLIKLTIADGAQLKFKVLENLQEKNSKSSV